MDTNLTRATYIYPCDPRGLPLKLSLGEAISWFSTFGLRTEAEEKSTGLVSLMFPLRVFSCFGFGGFRLQTNTYSEKSIARGNREDRQDCFQ